MAALLTVPLRFRIGGKDCDVIVGADLLTSVPALLTERRINGRCAIISDSAVAGTHAAVVAASLKTNGFERTLITIASGEASKSIEQAGAICEQMARAGLNRSSFVAAVGGGVVGDLAGFAASIYHRGIPWVNVPTTLLAQVDSAIGGKTGVNTAAGKNLIGSFHHPALVIVDVDTLRTLPQREWNSGFAEVIKHGIIRDAGMFRSLANFDRGDLAPLIRRNLEIKSDIVAVDERETSAERALLNFGHTIGHAIENAAGYGELLHGEAVSLGIVAACDVSVRKAGLSPTERDEVVATLERFDLPTHLPGNLPREKIAEALRFDKKFQRGQIKFVVTPSIGSARVATDVTLADLEQAIARL